MGGLKLSKLDRPYESQWEIIENALYWIDLRVSCLYEHHAWLGVDNNMQQLMGIVISKDEFELRLENAAELYIDNEKFEDSEDAYLYIQHRLSLTDVDNMPIFRLFKIFDMDYMEKACTLIAIASHLDEKYARIFAYLQDDINKRKPGIRLSVLLCARNKDLVARYEYEIKNSKALSYIMNDKAFENNELVLSKYVLSFLLFEDNKKSFKNEKFVNIYQDEHKIVDNIMNDNQKVIGLLCGSVGSGRSSILKQTLFSKKKGIVVLDVHNIDELKSEIKQQAVKAMLQNDVFCIRINDIEGDNKDFLSTLQNELDSLPQKMLPIFVLAHDKFAFDDLKTSTIRITIPKLTNYQRELLFYHHLKGAKISDDLDLAEVATKFVFLPGQISQAMKYALLYAKTKKQDYITKDILHDACYDLITYGDKNLTSHKAIVFGLDDLVIPQLQKQMIKQACEQVKYAKTVYEEWQFEKKVPYGRGVSILLSGAPGTGKTMCASIIASELKMRLQTVEISQVVSKYIGETEKNLDGAFQQAEKSSSILFFDECDAIFGKRSEVNDAHDRHANVEVAYLLQKMESYDGVVILATNLIQNIDEAFMRRMKFIIHFPFPDKNTRVKLLKKMIPQNAPVSDDIDFDFLADKFHFSGGNIKNIVLYSAFLAAAQQKEISMYHLLFAAVNEQRKNGIVIVKEDLGEYADLIEMW